MLVSCNHDWLVATNIVSKGMLVNSSKSLNELVLPSWRPVELKLEANATLKAVSDILASIDSSDLVLDSLQRNIWNLT